MMTIAMGSSLLLLLLLLLFHLASIYMRACTQAGRDAWSNFATLYCGEIC
jgi:hypothetical protein